MVGVATPRPDFLVVIEKVAGSLFFFLKPHGSTFFLS
jgi:hypothetical protein